MRRTHGDSSSGSPRHRFYTVWKGIRQRCHDPKHISYRNYGGRGIELLWNSYEEFKRDMLIGYRRGLWIERIDNNGPYCKANCRWATPKEQNNNSRANHRLLFGGHNLTLTQWAAKTGLSLQTISTRLRLGWSAKEVLLRAVQGQKLYLKFGGKNRTLTQWGAKLGVKAHTLQARLYYGWSVKRILTAPVRPWGR